MGLFQIFLIAGIAGGSAAYMAVLAYNALEWVEIYAATAKAGVAAAK